ncbi:neprilysin-1-like [Ornithodoros turicata]|uniref:neprilysin-1-like n=1 Tax=Ornithodoros turicata TaxID=34597 RepID=UPI0031394293
MEEDRRRRERQISVYTAFACVIAAVVIIALLVAVTAKKVVHHKAERWPAGPLPFDRRYDTGDLLKEVTNRSKPAVCPTCQWNDAYLFDSAKEYKVKDVCSNFYVHACNQRWLRGTSLANRPYAEFSAGQLMLDVDYFFKRFLSLRGRSENNFLAQAMWVYDRCNANDSVVESVQSVLSSLMLPDWPFENWEGDLVWHVATAERTLRLQPLFEVVFRKNTRSALPVILRAPKTLHQRYQQGGFDEQSYATYVAASLQRYTKNNASAIADGIVRLEKAIEAFAAQETPSKVLSLEQLFASERWNWMKYFDVVFDGKYSMLNHTMIVVQDPVFFANLRHIFRGRYDTSVINYIGYKAVAEFSPFLGDPFLMRLSHGYRLPDLHERQVACMALLEKVYPYGLGIAAKLTLGKEFATTYRTHLDSQMQFFFSLSRKVIVQLVQSHKSWIDPVDTATAVRKLQAMQLHFGTQANLIEYELYRRTRPVKGNTTIEAVLGLYSHASALYWDVAKDAGFDNMVEQDVFLPGSLYQEADNRLLVPHAVVGFLNHISNQVHPILYPAVMVHIMRGALAALAPSASSFVKGELRNWWSVSTKGAYENISRCLQAQYPRMSSPELNLLDNALMYPLFLIYKASLEKLKGVHASVNSEQLFFYNYAVALCERKSSGPMQGMWRVNVPLRNFPAFSRAFGCQWKTYMNPAEKCIMWAIS